MTEIKFLTASAPLSKNLMEFFTFVFNCRFYFSFPKFPVFVQVSLAFYGGTDQLIFCLIIYLVVFMALKKNCFQTYKKTILNFC